METEYIFEGIKVCDFSWSIMAPLATKCLADYGATVVKIESHHRLDIARRASPFVGAKSGVDRSAIFATYNTSKYSLALNLSHPDGIEIARELVAWSDIVIENFRPGVMERLGLDYDAVKKLRPNIIMVRASLQGQTGPRSAQPGYGVMMQALPCVVHMTGWPDRSPVGPPVPFTDYVAANYLTAIVLVALDYRDRTGRGQYIDLGQLEAGATFVAPEILDYTVNRYVQRANGNRNPYAAPHGVFRCKGEDRWCAIAIFNDTEWEAFKQAIGIPAWAKEPRFATFIDRKVNESELEKLIENWTSKRTAEEVMATLQAVGVPAGVVKNGKDLCEDAQLKHNGYFHWLEHPVIGLCPLDTHPFRFSKSECHVRRPPCLGEHTEYVCKEILKMSDERFIQLLQGGVFE